MTPAFFSQASQVLEILRVHSQIPLLVGCSSAGLIAGGQEIEDRAGLVVGLFALPGAELKAFHFTQAQVEESNGPGYWHLETGISPEQTNGWLIFADPFHLDAESWLRGWNEAYAPLPMLGGLASGDYSEQITQVYLNGDVFEAGGVAVCVGGDVKLVSVISQGCTPIGNTWTITRVERNVIHEIANRPAYEVLAETFAGLRAAEKTKMQGNLFVGLVINEYLEEFQRGDFLVRNLLGADPRSGAIAVGAFPRTGQTIQFQRRDAAAATEDMLALLSHDLRRVPLQLQRARPPPFRPAEPRCGFDSTKAGPVGFDRLFLQRRNRAGRRPQFSARLHGFVGALREEMIGMDCGKASGPTTTPRSNATVLYLSADFNP